MARQVDYAPVVPCFALFTVRHTVEVCVEKVSAGFYKHSWTGALLIGVECTHIKATEIGSSVVPHHPKKEKEVVTKIGRAHV